MVIGYLFEEGDAVAPDDDLAEIFKKAAEIASVVPEAMQEAAFHRALDALQGEAAPREPRHDSAKRSSRPAAKAGVSGGEKEDPVDAFQQLARSSAPEVDTHEGALARSLAVLLVAERELRIERLSAPQIAKVLTDKFRWKVTPRGVSMALDGAGRLVDRRKDGRAVSYRLMAPGEAWLDDRLAAAEGGEQGSPRKPARRRTTRKRAAAKKVSGAADDVPAKAATKRVSVAKRAPSVKKPADGKRRASRVGPKEAVEGLISNGFFGSPQTISDIREELELGRALRFKATDLSPTLVRLLRDGRLTRKKNNDGQYEYLASGA